MKIHNPIAWFEIVTQDIERAIKFYENTFEVSLTRYKENSIEMAIFPYPDGGVGGALVCGECYVQHQAGASTIVIYLTTDSVTKQLARIKQYGGEEILPVMSIGENGYIAGFKDCEGNHIGIWSKDE